MVPPLIQAILKIFADKATKPVSHGFGWSLSDDIVNADNPSPSMVPPPRMGSLVSTLAGMEYFQKQQQWAAALQKESGASYVPSAIVRQQALRAVRSLLLKNMPKQAEPMQNVMCPASCGEVFEPSFYKYDGEGGFNPAILNEWGLSRVFVQLKGDMCFLGIRISSLRGESLREKAETFFALKASTAVAMAAPSSGGFTVDLKEIGF